MNTKELFYLKYEYRNKKPKGKVYNSRRVLIDYYMLMAGANDTKQKIKDVLETCEERVKMINKALIKRERETKKRNAKRICSLINNLKVQYKRKKHAIANIHNSSKNIEVSPELMENIQDTIEKFKDTEIGRLVTIRQLINL